MNIITDSPSRSDRSLTTDAVDRAVCRYVDEHRPDGPLDQETNTRLGVLAYRARRDLHALLDTVMAGRGDDDRQLATAAGLSDSRLADLAPAISDVCRDVADYLARVLWRHEATYAH